MKRICLTVGVMVLGLCVAAPASEEKPAQTQDEQYLTWVRFYRVKADWDGDFLDCIRRTSGQTLDGLVKDGALSSWGVFVPFTLAAGDDWSHAVWLSAKSWAEMDKVVTAFDAADKARAKEDEAELRHTIRAAVEPGSVRDIVVRNVVVVQNTSSAAAGKAPAYFKLSFYTVRPGHERDAESLYRELAVPLYRGQMGSGVVLDAGLATQEIVSEANWTHLSWVVTGDLASLDEIRRASAAAEEARTGAENAELQKKFQDYFDRAAYHSKIVKIVHMQAALPAAE